MNEAPNINTRDIRQALVIEHTTTEDAPDGQCWPPALGEGWHLLRTVDGHTLWRRIWCGVP
jgi:hypothetical protein